MKEVEERNSHAPPLVHLAFCELLCDAFWITFQDTARAKEVEERNKRTALLLSSAGASDAAAPAPATEPQKEAPARPKVGRA